MRSALKPQQSRTHAASKARLTESHHLSPFPSSLPARSGDDCDLNQQLDLTMAGGARGGGGLSVWDVDSTDELTGRGIAIDNHCFGCTAGLGSGCGGQ